MNNGLDKIIAYLDLNKVNYKCEILGDEISSITISRKVNPSIRRAFLTFSSEGANEYYARSSSHTYSCVTYHFCEKLINDFIRNYET